MATARKVARLEFLEALSSSSCDEDSEDELFLSLVTGRTDEIPKVRNFVGETVKLYSDVDMVTRTKKVFVGGLSAPTTLEDVKNYFQQFGRTAGHTTVELKPSLQKELNVESPAVFPGFPTLLLIVV
ncbi:hypothetical protein HPB50_014497 [Hyalomma asiaticum]|uniref:Uncharacterized protein n=1 Tax=Hyalomma asiaticum TaxID=266040 RepID=A0ACB7SEV0_HYAAI|nr:hypothetical protein HPB50_014497 [Hyalomma asiaticum]